MRFQKILSVIVLVVLLAFAATPAFAQGDNGEYSCFGGNTVVPAGEVTRDVAAFGCSVTVEAGARVQRDVAAYGGNVIIAGEVEGSVVAFGGDVFLRSTAVVRKDVVTFGGHLHREEGAVVRGNVINNPFSVGRFVAPVAVAPFNPTDALVGIGWGLFRSVITALALAALGALLVVFVPEQTRRVNAVARASFGPSLGIGCLTLFILPFLLLLLVITIIGIPFAALVLFAAAAAWVFGWIAIGWLAGEKILEAIKVREILPIIAVIVGVVVLALLGEVPILGWLLTTVVGLTGLGAVVLTRFGTRGYPYQPAVAPVAVSLTPAPVQPVAPPETPAEPQTPASDA
jgi:hypothetical protein